jgi:hypothetical protein
MLDHEHQVEQERYDQQEQIYTDVRIIGFTDGVFNLEPEMPEDPKYMAGYRDGQSRYYDDIFSDMLGNLAMMQDKQTELEAKFNSQGEF